MKRDFFTGLTLLLPFAITLAIALFLINLLTNPFEEAVYAVLSQYESLHHHFLFFSSKQILYLFSKLLVLLLLFGLVLFIGFLAHLVYGRTLFLLGDKIMHRIPLVRTVYKGVQEGVNSFMQSKNNLFSQVVIVPFPHPQGHSIGMVHQPITSFTLQEKSISVFIPSGLNPTYGIVLYYKKEELIPIDMSVDDAFKLIVSCGAALQQSNYEQRPKA